jgi:hypothetical protein
MESEWNFFTPNIQEKYKINIYDDGNKKYEQYVNEWLLFGHWRGKCALVNANKSDIKINSISLWKIIKIHSRLI